MSEFHFPRQGAQLQLQRLVQFISAPLNLLLVSYVIVGDLHGLVEARLPQRGLSDRAVSTLTIFRELA